MNINFVVGKNGSGKTRHLQKAASNTNEETILICNTVHDRYKAKPNIKKLSIRNLNSTPSRVLKTAFIELAREGTYRLNTIAKALEYCHYAPEIMFRIVIHKKAHNNIAELQHAALRGRLDGDVSESAILAISEDSPVQNMDFEIDLTQSYIHPKVEQSLLGMLESEKGLKRLKLVTKIDVYVRHKKHGEFLKIEQASSGELTLIASQVFILSNLRDCRLILIDEPENSLHPQWQKDYVNNLGNLIGRHDAHIMIATHSPLIVSGIRNSDDLIGFYHAETDTQTEPSYTVPSAEESLWEQFETITPESRYVSDHIVDLLESLESNNKTLDEVIKSLDEMEEASYDRRQKKALQAAKNLAFKIYQEAHNV